MRIMPTADNVVLEKRDGKSNGSLKLVLPDKVADERKGWFVVEVGPDVKRCKQNDQIVYNSDTGAGQIELEGKTFVVMSEKDIVGVVVS